MKRNRVTVGVLIITNALIFACSITSSFNHFASRKLIFPKAEYWRVGWLNNQLVAFIFGENSTVKEFTFAKEGDSSFSSFMIDQGGVCNNNSPYPPHYSLQSIMDNNMVQITKDCYSSKSTTDLLIYNWNSKTVERQIGPFPNGTVLAFWNPDQTQALVYFDDGYSESTLFELKGEKFGPLDLKITDEGKSWNFKNFYPDFPDVQQTTADVGRADWSPDGNSIAFFASPDAMGKTDTARMSARYKIYLMEAKTNNIKPLLDNIYYPYTITWSPDAKYLAFMGRYKESSDGVWLYSFDDSSIKMVDQGDFHDILWGKNSSSLIAIKCVDYLCNTSDIIEYTIK